MAKKPTLPLTTDFLLFLLNSNSYFKSDKYFRAILFEWPGFFMDTLQICLIRMKFILIPKENFCTVMNYFTAE